jgi:hypothetical protein
MQTQMARTEDVQAIIASKNILLTESPLYPLRFEPIYQYRPWGGRRLADLLTEPERTYRRSLVAQRPR